MIKVLLYLLYVVILGVLIFNQPWLAVPVLSGVVAGWPAGRAHAQGRYFWHGVKRAHHQATE